jgi:glycosyltransferase involved in cell wall biosynthesis
MRILIVSKYFPDNLTTKVHGVHKRFRMFLDAIKGIAQIDLLYYVPNGIDISQASVMRIEQSLSDHFETPLRLSLSKRSNNSKTLSKLAHYAMGTFSFVQQPSYSITAGPSQIQSLETCLRNNPDAVFIHKLEAMCPFLKTRRALPRIFFDLDDIEHVALKRRLRYLQGFSNRLKHHLLFPSLCWGEYKSIKLAHRTFVCSDNDRNYLMKRWGLKGVVKIPNAVKIPEGQPITSEQTLLFLGSYNYKPNIDAVEFLILKIWPLIRRAVPNAILKIAGTPPERIPSYHAELEGVKFIGFVEELDDLYRNSRVVCVPILSGSGTRVKIIEAAAYGKPIVSTRIGAEGVEFQDGIEIFLRDDPESFAKACIRLLNDYTLSERMGVAARSTAIKKYNQTKIKQKIQEIIKRSNSNSNSIRQHG